MKLEVPINIPDEQIQALIESVIDPMSGPRYWMEFRHPKYKNPMDVYTALFNGQNLTVIDTEENKEYTWNMESVQKGLIAMANHAPRHFANFLTENDDAETADVFLQCCIFGKITYG